MSTKTLCRCGNQPHPDLWGFCVDCFFNDAVEAKDGDYVVNETTDDGRIKSITLHNGKVVRL